MVTYNSSEEFYKDKLKRLKELAKVYEKYEAKRLANFLDVSVDNKAKVTQQGSTVNITPNNTPSRSGIVDLKEGFRRSPHSKLKKSGHGWYMIVPIRRYTNKPGTKGMNNRMYEQLRKYAMDGKKSRTVISDYLYDRKAPNNPDSLLNYTPQSNHITKIDNAPRRGSRYIAFRTVSDKSHPASWILNRAKATSMDDEQVAEIVEKVKMFYRDWS